MRFTVKQKTLSEGMRVLLSLYNDLKETPKDKWFDEPFVRMIAELAFQTLPDFVACIFMKHYNRLLFYSGQNGGINITLDTRHV